MGYKGLSGSTQWQTWGKIYTAGAPALTNYMPADLTAAIRSAKMISVHPGTAIIMRTFVVGSPGNQVNITISGWMGLDKPKTSGPGQRLFIGTLTAGAKSLGASTKVLEDGKWTNQTWLEMDNYVASPGSNMAGSVKLIGFITNQETCLLFPTLAYTHLLLEITSLNPSQVGFIWRPIWTGQAIRSI